jgi:hypothetical protein
MNGSLPHPDRAEVCRALLQPGTRAIDLDRCDAKERLLFAGQVGAEPLQRKREIRDRQLMLLVCQVAGPPESEADGEPAVFDL